MRSLIPSLVLGAAALVARGGELELVRELEALRPVGSVAVSSSAGVVAGVGPDGRLVVWRDGRELPSPPGLGALRDVALSPDGRALVWRGRRERAGVVALDGWRGLVSLAPEGGTCAALDFSRDGRLLAVALELRSPGRIERRLQVWATDTWEPRELPCPKGVWASGVRFSPDATRLALGSSDGIVVIQLSDGAPLARLPHRYPSSVAWSPDGARLAAVSSDGKASLFRSAGGSVEASFEVDWGYAWGTSLAFSGDGRELLLGGLEAPVVHRFDVRARAALPPLDVGARVTSVAVASDGTRVVSTIRGDVLLTSAAGEARGRLTSRAGASALAFGGGHLAAGGPDGRVRLHDAARFELEATLELERQETSDLAFSADGAHLAAVCPGYGGVRVWRLADRAVIQEVRLGNCPLYAVAFTPDGKRLAVGGARNQYAGPTPRVWVQPVGARPAPEDEEAEPRLGEPGEEPLPGTGWVSGLAVAPQGLLALTDDVILLLPAAGLESLELRGHCLAVRGSLVAYGGRPSALLLFDLGERHDLEPLDTPRPVQAVAIGGPPGEERVAATAGSEVLMWRLADRALLARWDLGEAALRVAVGEDGQHLAVAGDRRTVVLRWRP